MAPVGACWLSTHKTRSEPVIGPFGLNITGSHLVKSDVMLSLGLFSRIEFGLQRWASATIGVAFRLLFVSSPKSIGALHKTNAGPGESD